ncbi:MAG: hypothetical protein HRU38_15795 [Saccharospirillaceae bacterium]|nr:hypothetical protein [Pseudomonadales bacterium]NRB80104.1 hypothetical protein [Saccharospirillaceae bacterium]
MRSLYKKASLIIGIYFLITLVYLIFNKDDALNPEITQFIKLSEPVPPTDAHAMLYTLDAPIESDVISLGRQAISQFNLNNNSALTYGDIKENYFDYKNKLDIKTDQSSSCLKELQLCFDDFKNNIRTFKKFNEIDKTISSRIKRLESSPPIGYAFESTSETPHPKNQLRFHYQNRDFQRLIYLFINSEIQYVFDYLLKDTQLKRSELKTNNTLIAKMISTKLIMNNIELLEIFSKQNKYQAHIPEFVFEEIDMNLVYSKEYRTYYNIINELYSGKNSEGVITSEETIFDRFGKKAVIKPNKTLNSYYTMIQAQFWHQENTLDHYLTQDSNQFIDNDFSLNNFVGYLINSTAIPNYSKYQLEVLKLSCLTSEYNKSINSNYSQTPLISNQQCLLIESLLKKENK